MLLWSGVALATTQAITRTEACRRADAVVVGEITGVEGAWRTDGAIETRVDVAVERATKGDAPGDLVVHVLGGAMGGLRMRVSEAPALVQDQRYVLLLVHGDGGWEVLGREGAIAIRRADGQGRGEAEADALASLGTCR
jgi:hypothetical protein